MTYFLQQGSAFRIISEADIGVTERLPLGTYVVKQPFPPLDELELEKVDDFKPAQKLYGNTASRAERVLDTFDDRPNGTGVLLAGEKGSGKTLLAREISIAAAKRGYPTILISTARSGDTFNQLIQNIDQPAVLIFDEFEKTYRESAAQEAILTLLDGTFQTKKLFVFTVNNVHALNDHMLNRPGRLYYYMKFEGLEEQFIRDYCDDVLKDMSKADQIVSLSQLFTEFNFDMLKAVVEELNRYGEDVHEVVKMLNAKPAGGSEGEFNVELTVPGKKIKPYNYKWRGNPLSNSAAIEIYFSLDKSSDGDTTIVESYGIGIDDDDVDSSCSNPARFGINHLLLVSPREGKYVYDNGTAKLVLTRTGRFSEYDLFKVL